MKKKLISAILVCSMALSMLVGCGNQSAEVSEPAESVESQTESGESKEQPSEGEQMVDNEDQVITFWCWDPDYNINALKVAEAIYQKDHPNFSIEVVEMSAGDIGTKLTTATSSNKLDTLADVVLFDDSAFSRAVKSYMEAFLDLTDYGFNYNEFAEAKVAASVINGRNYGIPFDSGTAIACYRTDVLAEAGYTIEDFTDITWSEFTEKATVVLEKTGKPLLSGQGAYNQLGVMVLSAGGNYFDEDGNVNLVNNDVVVSAVNAYVDMVEAGVFQEETGWDTYLGNIVGGNVAGVINGAWIMSTLKRAEDQSGLWAITNIPKLDDVASATNYSSQGGSSWAVTANCQNPELVIDFFKSTFGGSKEFYDEILSSGAISTWLPAADSEKYEEPDEFFNGQPVFSIITNYSAGVPATTTYAFESTARNQLNNAVTNILYSGGIIEEELKAAEETVAFDMEQQ